MPIRPERMGLYPGGSIKSPEWRAIRASIQQRAANACEECGVGNYAIGGRRDDGTWCPALPKGERLLRLEWPQPGEWAWCKGEDRQRLRIIRIVCTVAHVDGDETHNEEANLRFWCQRCHNRHDAKQRRSNAAETRRRQQADGDMFTAPAETAP